MDQHQVIVVGGGVGGTPSLKQIYTAQEYAVRAVQAIDRREHVARRTRILEAKR